MKKVSVIIVNWNGLHHLKKCLPTLFKIDYPSYEVILVDNASTDGSQDYVRKNFKKVKIVQNRKNLGFAGGNNVALPYATGRYVLLLNNDTAVEKNFLSELVVSIEKDSEIGVVQSKIISMDDPTRLDSVGAFYTNTGFLFHYGYLQKNKAKYDATKYLYTAKGACMLVKKEIIDVIDLFDNNFFAYFEETDFCNRVWLAGYSVVYAPKSIIYHKVGGTSNSMDNSFIQFHSFKNRINSYCKNLEARTLIQMLAMHIFLCEIAAISFIFKGRMDLFFAINKAFYWNLANIKITLKLRRKIQSKYRKVKDHDFMSKVSRNPGIRYYYSLFAKSLVGYRE